MNPSIERLVRLLPENEVGNIINLINHIVCDHRPAHPETVCDMDEPLTDIGVWHRNGNNGNAYRRRKDPMDVWKTWADKQTLEIKDDHCNIAFIGESVARGFLYDPFLTPAGVLQDILNQRADRKYHVIDLARTNMGFFESLDLCRQAVRLPCHHLVYFGGNNWSIVGDVYSFADMTVLAEQLRQGDMQAYGRSMVAAVEKQTLHLFNVFQDIRRKHEIRMTFVIPAFNLKDWTPGFGNLPPLIKADRLNTWLKLKSRALAMIAQNKPADAETIVEHMLTLDGETCCDSLHLMGRIYQWQGKFDSAKNCFNKAKDTYGILPVRQVPSPHEQLRQTVLDHHQQYDIDIVDLPDLFARLTPDGIPDRTLFLDYCHLTKEAMAAAMTETAKQICRTSAAFDVSDYQLPELDDDTEAGTCFLAAVHNANWGQGQEIIDHYCRKAYETSPDSASRLFNDYLNFETAAVPRWACQSFERFSIQQARRYKSFSENQRLADFMLKNSMLAALTADHGGTIANHWMERLQTVLGIHSEPVDLLKSCYSERFHGENHPYHVQRGYTQFCRPRTDFYLVCRQAETLVLKLVWKVPAAQDTGSAIRIRCNEHDVATFAASAQWQKTTVEIQDRDVRNGINVIQLIWPDYGEDHEKACERAAYRMERKLPAELFPVFGHIHHFTARHKR